MKLSVAQLRSGQEKRSNLNEIRRMTEEAVAGGGELVVFPEFAMYNHVRLDKTYVDNAEPLDGEFCQGLMEIARNYNTTLVAGVLETSDVPDRAYNTLVVFNSDGDLVTKYRKLHLYDAFDDRESDIVEAGAHAEPAVFDVGGVNVGLLTCYDLRFPEAFRFLADADVELALVPASWTPGIRKEDHWRTLARARAIENTFYVAAVCQAPPISTGGSLIADPLGVVVGEVGEGVEVITRSISSKRVGEIRAWVPCLKNRRFGVVPV